MKSSKKNFKSVGQNTLEEKKSNKHDANLQKNSTLYFQIGLILCLLGTYALFEMEFQDKKFIPDTAVTEEVALIDVAPEFKVEQVKVKKTKPKVDRATEVKDKIKEVPDDAPMYEEKLMITEPTDDFEPVEIGTLSEEEDPEDENVVVPFIDIQSVPIYPGCEKYKTNDKRKKCMSKKVQKLVLKKFNTNLGSEYGLSGKQTIQTQFTIDKNGKVTDVKVRAPHPKLESEARRVINKIPQMIPGSQRDVPVGVLYTLPITFQVIN